MWYADIHRENTHTSDTMKYYCILSICVSHHVCRNIFGSLFFPSTDVELRLSGSAAGTYLLSHLTGPFLDWPHLGNRIRYQGLKLRDTERLKSTVDLLWVRSLYVIV